MASKYDGLSRIIIQNVGGKDNIQAITHCVTRLRFTLKDEGKANTDILKSTDGVVTVLQSGGQYQVVIGNHVPDVYASVVSVGHLESLAAKPDGEDDGPKEKMNPFSKEWAPPHSSVIILSELLIPEMITVTLHMEPQIKSVFFYRKTDFHQR